MALTQNQTNKINEMRRNPLASIAFAYDNNPEGFKAQLGKMGFSIDFNGHPDDRAKAISLVFSWVREKQFGKLKDFFDGINYKDTGGANYTQGFRDYFYNSTPQALVNANNISQGTNTAQRFSFDGLLSGLGQGLVTYSNVTANEGSGVNTPNAQAVAQAAKDKAAADKKRNTWIAGIAGISILGIILAIVFSKKTT